MTVKQLPLGPFATNCFLVFNGKTNDLFIIDPADEADKIVAEAEKFPFRSARILLTHAHIDHISAAGKVAARLAIPQVELSTDDHDMYNSPENAIPPYFPPADDLPEAAGFSPVADCTIIPLPGHTKGGSGFLFDDGSEKFLIAGDTIFCGSVGRTDLPGSGEHEELIGSIRSRLFPLPDETRIFPGHGEESTIQIEKQFNQFLR